MNNPPPAPRGYGCLIALCLLLGPVIGWFVGQAALGMVAGLVIGVIVAVLAGLADKRRHPPA